MKNLKLEIESKIMEIELRVKAADTILQDQENAYFDLSGECKEAYIMATHDNASTRNYTAIMMVREALKKIEELEKLCCEVKDGKN